jgi:hypothetical protein
VTPRKRIILASIVVGFIGAVAGGFLGFVYAHPENPRAPLYWSVFASGIAGGFLACFSLSLSYLRIMEQRDWQAGIFSGLIYAVSAGAILIIILGISWEIETGSFKYHLDQPGDVLSGIVFFILRVGMPLGVIAWFILNLLYILFAKELIAGKQAGRRALF